MSSVRRLRAMAAAVVIVLTYNCIVAAIEAKSPEPLAVMYLGLSAFVGSYAALDGQPEQPSAWMAGGLVAAILITFTAALTVVEQLTRTQWTRWRLGRISQPIVIVGSSREADTIARSITPSPTNCVVRLVESNAAPETGSVTITDLDALASDKTIKRIVASASSLVVAASTDAVSATLAAQIRALRHDQQSPVHQLIRSTAIADAVRPRELTDLPSVQTFHPADTIGQIVTTQVRQWRPAPCRVVIERFGDSDDPVADAVKRWLDNADRAGQILGTPLLSWDSFTADITILTGSPEQVAARCAHLPDSGLTIAIAPLDLVRTVCPSVSSAPWTVSDQGLGLMVLDPERAGLDYQTIIDDIALQWGRGFHEAHQSLYVAAEPTPWNPDTRGRAEQSSIAAAKYMLTVLSTHGYHLEACQDPHQLGWMDGLPDAALVEAMARMEHDEWRTNRTWKDPSDGTLRRVALKPTKDVPVRWVEGPASIPYENLPREAVDFNCETILKVYPALAATFGYGIRRTQSPSGA